MSFDRIAPIYDRLARLVFGKTWRKVQLAPAEELNQASKVLIVGGGTGEILGHLKGGIKVTYVEISQRMIAQAKRKNIEAPVDYIHHDFLTWETDQEFDAILLPFFLDCFEKDDLIRVIVKVVGLLAGNGKLLVVDFQEVGFLRDILVKIMYLFFRSVSGLKGKRLLDYNTMLHVQEFIRLRNQHLLGGWVFYATYISGRQ